jgi:glutathione synthase/RimK-type ligase-like ATP-grasp enzyme
MVRVAFLTLEDSTGFVIDDQLAIDALSRRGASVEQVPWRTFARDVAVAEPAFDAAIVRTTWDYQHDLPAFFAALAAIERAGVELANSASIIEWNAHKRYLLDLASRGVPIVPSRYGDSLDEGALRALPAALDSDRIVLKPAIGANAGDTFRLFDGPPIAGRSLVAHPAHEHSLSDPSIVAELLARYRDRAWIAQPYLRSIEDEGERSLFYFGAERCHAVSKRPASGDFRVQEEHGGLIASCDPDEEMIAVADGVMRSLDQRTLQARVDIVRRADGRWALMELELIEPSLYFRMHEAAPERFADAVLAWLAASRTRVA